MLPRDGHATSLVGLSEADGAAGDPEDKVCQKVDSKPGLVAGLLPST